MPFLFLINMQIANEYLTATFKTQGAELTSLLSKSNKKEYIWQAEAKYWNRHAPVLFPFVGRLKGDTYQYQGASYQVGQHGFARDRKFEVLEHQSDSIMFSLISDKESFKQYPFHFEFRITYELDEHLLKVRYEVHNAAEQEMYFSIGGHPAFNCPMSKSEVRSDYSLIFEKKEKAERHLLVDGVFSGATEPVLENSNRLPITELLFDADALVFKNLKSKSVTLESSKSKWLTFHFDGFPYLGIWSKNRESPFVCIEPWFGLADNADHDGLIENKEGIQKLAGEQTFVCEYGIEIHD
ncbi:MAG: galactose mutarotase-like enzyme [Marinoscillum sp.]|jgi:galactose mutarotase-like enzyme